MDNVWSALGGEWRALPDIARKVGVTEAEASIMLDRYLRRRMAERMLGSLPVEKPKPALRTSTWYRRML